MSEDATAELQAVEPARGASWTEDPKLMFLKSFWQLVVGSAAIVGGLVAILIGWFGASGTDQVWAQMPYLISGGILGLALVFGGAAMIFAFYLARLNLVTEVRLRAVEEAVRGAPAPPEASEPAPANGGVVAAQAGTKFHKPGCGLVAGKTGTRTLTPSQASREGLQPCGICEPA